MNGEKLRILLVEDNPTDALLVREALAEAISPAFVVAHAEMLQCALDLLAKRPFDLVLLDLGLPDSQGLESLTSLRRLAPEVPVLVLTGLDDEDVGLNAVHAGAQDYLVKGDLSEKSLPRIIRYSVERKRLEDLLRQAQRLDAIGQLAGGIAHDFNSLLTLINGHLSVITADHALSSESAESAREIQTASGRAAELTRQLLTFSRRQPLSGDEARPSRSGSRMRALGQPIAR
jgi:DNA-binding response OmpR family regulator